MKLIKKFLSITVFAFILVGSVFSMTACNLINVDKNAYYNQVIATFKYNDQTINVTMTDLNNAFKTYGYNRFNQGYYETMEECINDSLKYHIQKELLFLDIADTLNTVYVETEDELYNLSFADLETYNWDKTLSNIYASDTANALEIRYDAFMSMQASVDSFAESILEEDDELATLDQETKPEPIRPVKTEYDSSINIIDEIDNNGQRVISIEKDIEELQLFDKTNISEHYNLIYNYDQETTAKAYSKYVKALQQTAKSEGRSTKVEDVIALEESVAIKEAYCSKLLELYQ